MDNKAIKSLILDVVLKAAIRQIIAAVPFLSWPVINPLVTYLITKVATVLYDHMALYISFQLIDFKTDQEQKAYTKAVEELKAAHAAPNATEKQLNDAKEKFRRNLGDLIRFKPS